jgi:hypothetical protein
MDAGRYQVRWDGRNDAGTACATGVYLLRLVSGHKTAVRKMLLLR